jgi:uroporphyrinogen-III synthase
MLFLGRYTACPMQRGIEAMRDKTIAILESRLGEQFAALIVKHGAKVIHAPALAEIPDVDPARIEALVAQLETQPAKVAVFQTGVGTRALFNATDSLGATERLREALAKATVVVRGPKPTAVLRSRNVRIDLSARDPYTTAEVLELLDDIPLEGERVIVQRYGAINAELDEALEARGAQVIEIPTYRWSMPQDTRPLVELMDALDRGQVDAVAFTNAAQVQNLFKVADELGRTDALRSSLGRTLIASIGPVSSHALRDAGIQIGLEASPPKLGTLMLALDRALSTD